MDYIKKNKYTVIVLVAFIIFVLVLGQIKNLLFPNEGKPIYGNRLDGIVNIEDSTYKNMVSEIKKSDKVENVTYNINAKQIKVFIELKEIVSTVDAKKEGDKVPLLFSESQRGSYDFQIFLTKKDASQNNFPIIGYKHHNSSKVVWLKDREVKKNESNGGK